MNKILEVSGVFEYIDKEKFYKIENNNLLKPFFINIVSDNDIWMFLSSSGGLTAGRKDSTNSLFPYETNDKIYSQSETGSKTIIRTENYVWEPFEKSKIKRFDIIQNIYKGVYGNILIFEEINKDLNLVFRYKWETSQKYGIVRTSTIENVGDKNTQIEILDGIQNIMPNGVNSVLEVNSSCLVDAYKANELDENNLIGIYSLTTLINDSPTPIEVLKANVAWNISEDKPKVLLSSEQIQKFSTGGDVETETEVYGSKGAYLTVHKFNLNSNSLKSWVIVMDVGYSHSQIVDLQKLIENKNFDSVFEDINKSKENLKIIVAMSDGLQETGDDLAKHHQYLNVLYNVMRGGIFMDAYAFNYEQFIEFVALRNKNCLNNHEILDKLKTCKTISELKAITASNKDLYRLSLEFMPLSFSRRHGDPSRPWNKFNIELKNDKGEKIYNYEGNWRDIFQNWEALSISYPNFIENMISKFVNASTIDGFNPYKINKVGIDWEKPEADNPFGGLGYWGDHQIIYLLKLMQQMKDFYPQKLNEMLDNEIFTYANVPYEIVSYADILKDSKNTILFNFEKDKKIEELAEQFGSDGKLIMKDGEVYHVTFIEKLIVPILSKISNLFVGGGIWMNTQRPEWNDANNAIVGIGLSMVTVYNLYQALNFYKDILKSFDGEVNISKEVVDWLVGTTSILEKYKNTKKESAKNILDELGNKFSDFRQTIYSKGFSYKQKTNIDEVNKLINLGIEYLTYTINANRFELFSSYNLLKDDFTVESMRNMLEGQSSIIASGFLKSNEVVELLDTMKNSKLYSNTLNSYYLYPIKKTTKFMNKNIIDNKNIPFDDKVLVKDCFGNIRFKENIITEEQLSLSLAKSKYTEEEKEIVANYYEDVFQKKKFTGRSEVMYKFEGIGCIYWHQNAKLLLGVQDCLVREYLLNGESENAKALLEEYIELTNGMGYRKEPKNWGAFPLDPYSHSSYNGKAEQPGMTGQVKEMVLARQRELGVIIENGVIEFHPFFVRDEEYLNQKSELITYDLNNKVNIIPLEKDTLAFTICQVPIIYKKSNTNKIEVYLTKGEKVTLNSLALNAELSQNIFNRDGVIENIVVYVKVD